MSLFSLVESRFKAQSKLWLSKDDNFLKHKNYLQNTLLKNFSPYFDETEFEQAVALFATDADSSVNQLYEVIKEALSQVFLAEQEKNERLLKLYNSGKLKMEDKGNGEVMVTSERDNTKIYAVSLTEYECGCPQGKKLSYAGLFCKHILAAYDVFKDKYPVPTASESTPVVQNFRIEKSKNAVDADTNAFFRYGSQTLTKRERTGNSYIPSGHSYVLDGGEPEVVIYALENNEPLLLVGDSGVGKSKMIHYLAQETNNPLIDPSAHADMVVENLLGAMTVSNGNTIWKDGVIPGAMRKGYWLLLDELNSIDPGVLKVLNELLDTRKITITVAGQPRIVKANQYFRLVCTMNPPDNPIYKGISSFSFEFMDRFDTVVYLDYLRPEVEIKLIIDETGYSDEEVVGKMVDFANRVRQGMGKGELFATVTTRGLISWAKKIEPFGIRTAAEVSVLRKMSSVDRNKALDLYKAIFKE